MHNGSTQPAKERKKDDENDLDEGVVNASTPLVVHMTKSLLSFTCETLVKIRRFWACPLPACAA